MPTLIGLGTLLALKAAALPALPPANDQYDGVLKSVGQSVAARFDTYTGRTLARKESATWEGTAERSVVVLPGYPVETITKVELLYYGQTLGTPPAWLDYTNTVPITADSAAGIVDLQYIQGTASDRLRITYAGGYWIDDTDDRSGEVPEGQTALPFDIFDAWAIQCAAEIQARNVFGAGALKDAKSATLAFAGDLQLLPVVAATLDTYRRFSA